MIKRYLIELDVDEATNIEWDLVTLLRNLKGVKRVKHCTETQQMQITALERTAQVVQSALDALMKADKEPS